MGGHDQTSHAATFPVRAADRLGLEAILRAAYPAAYRLAVGLGGGAAAASVVAARVLDRAAAVAPRWPSAEAAERWFLRFTVLASRETDRTADPSNGLGWLDGLSRQQREAFVLCHGLRLDLHRMGAAMDCSSSAAANHLVAATAELRAAGPVGEWAAMLADRLAAVVPPPAVVSADVARAVARRWWRGVARRWVIAATAATVAGAATWAVWHLWRVLVF